MTTQTTPEQTIVEIEGTDLDLTRIVEQFPEESTFGVALPGTSALPVPITADVLKALRPEYPARLLNAVAEAIDAEWIVTVREIHEEHSVVVVNDSGERAWGKAVDVRRVIVRLSANEDGLGAALSLFAQRAEAGTYVPVEDAETVGYTFIYGRPNKGRGWRSEVNWSADVTYLRKETRSHRFWSSRSTRAERQQAEAVVLLDDCEVGGDEGIAILDLRARLTARPPSALVERWEDTVHEQHEREQNVAAYDRDARNGLRDALSACWSSADEQAERQQAEAVDQFLRGNAERAEEYRLRADSTRWAKDTVEDVLRVEGQVERDGTTVLTLEQAVANAIDIERRFRHAHRSDRQYRLAVDGAVLVEHAVRGHVRVARTVTVSLVD